jgi:hypothetical protein
VGVGMMPAGAEEWGRGQRAGTGAALALAGGEGRDAGDRRPRRAGAGAVASRVAAGRRSARRHAPLPARSWAGSTVDAPARPPAPPRPGRPPRTLLIISSSWGPMAGPETAHVRGAARGALYGNARERAGGQGPAIASRKFGEWIPADGGCQKARFLKNHVRACLHPAPWSPATARAGHI